ncbi:hypothetical protein [Peribacillus sp. V2I11]|uniref:hypothetical protein n=1 Tax=Peribacillus sp. V2I11 TaxID=3042277 RepID=UPI00277EDC28|nr:hypothetical protein [Peribacillus sp. V2I11]MDQ0884213.1 hypothetical protein [Peribacillus sp. V2I11]
MVSSRIPFTILSKELLPKYKNKTRLSFMYFYFSIDEALTRLKKYATLLPNNWLAETPQTLAARRLGSQSAERERISEIN